MTAHPAKSPTRDVLEAIAGGLAGMVPIVGSPIAAALTLAMGWKHNERMSDWFRQVAEDIERLQADDERWRPENLAQNDEFFDAFLQASRQAVATSQEEKLAALRNGLLHSLDRNAPTAEERSRFFRLIDEFGPSHIRLLNILRDPAAAGLDTLTFYVRGGVREAIRGLEDFQAAPDGWIDLLASDLESAGLTHLGPLAMENKYGETLAPISTPLGRRFLAFIQEPSADADQDQ